MPNRLQHETSPYLLQHKDNPVDWYPWGEEALQLAREQDKPVLLSVGYSACHWCHVMAQESFEDAAVAAVMNRLFINIKVDREERPDLDHIYQAAQAMLAGRSGGWPLTLFLTPDQTPFFGGTYFPKTARHGMPGFVDLLPQVRAGLLREAVGHGCLRGYPVCVPASAGSPGASVTVVTALALSISSSTSQYSTILSTGVGSSAQLQPAMTLLKNIPAFTLMTCYSLVELTMVAVTGSASA